MAKRVTMDDRRAQSAQRAAPARRAREELRRDVTRQRRKVRRGKGPKADTRDVLTGSRAANEAKLRRDVKQARRVVKRGGGPKADTGDVLKNSRKVKKKSVEGLLGNALRNVRDVVVGAPASVVAIGKASGEDFINRGKDVLDSVGVDVGDKRAPGFKPIGEAIKRDDPLYALGEAAVKKVKGDDKGAARALERAGEKAYERPVDVAAYAAGGYGAAGRGATAVKHKGNTAAATARPPKRAEGGRESSPERVKRQRQAAKAEVKVRQDKATDEERRTAAKVTRKPGVRQEQRYSANAITRSAEKARENRKARQGKDPFRASPRKARKMRKRRFDEHSRNVHAGGLAREQRAAEQSHRQHKKLKRKERLTAAQLLANERVREGREAADLEALRRTARSREGGQRNAAALEQVKPEHLTDPKVREVAAEMRAGLRESEARAKREGFFEGRDGQGTNPEFVAALQPHLARGEIVQRSAGDAAPEGGRESLPPSKAKVVKERQEPSAPVKASQEQPKPTEKLDAEQELRRAAVRSLRKQIADVDKKIAAQPTHLTERPEYRDIPIESKRQTEERQRAGDLTPSPRVTRRIKTARRVPDDPKAMQALREQRAKLQQRLDRTILAGQAKGRKASTAARVVRPVRPAGAPVRAAAVEQQHAPDHHQHNEGEAQGGVIEQPAVHEPRGSQPDGKARKRTGVRVDRDGYYWGHGPKAGQRVVEADLEGEQGAFIRGLEHDSRPTTDLRQPRAGRGYSAEDAILGDLTDDRVLATRLDRERQITLIRLARSVEDTFAHRAGNQTRFAHHRAQQLANRLEGDWAPLRVDEQHSVVVPAEIADRWTRQISRPSRTERAGRYVTRQFIRTVLPFSVTWQAGNVADLFTRLVAADARFAVPGLAGASGRQLVSAVEGAMRDLDPHLADELGQALKGHFGARSTVAPLKFSDITEDARSALVRAAGEKVSAVRELPGVKQAADAGRAATDKAFGVGTKAESAMVRRAAGVAMRDYARALGHDVADHQALARKLASEFKDDPAKLLEFQRRTLEITGDYVTRGPGLKLIQHTTIPFVQWIKAANKFVFHTLPARHPYKTAFMLWAASITEAQRRELGLSSYITPDEARKLKLKPPQEGYLAGALGLPDGKSLPVSPLTSLGEAAGIIEGATRAAQDGDDGLETLLGNRVLPFVQTPVRKGREHGAEVGASRAVEAFVPGAKQARRVMEGERPHPRSTVVEPIGTGGKSTTDRILAGMTAPVGREFPEPEPKPGHSDAAPKVGERFPFTITGPGGKKRTVWKTRRR